MTNHWRDFKNSDAILVIGANPAENHPCGWKWAHVGRDERGTQIIHVDPRFTRTSAIADVYAPIRAGTDVAFFGGLINYILQHKLYHEDYVKLHTNAAFIVAEGYQFNDGLFSGYDQAKRSYDPTTWDYERLPAGAAPGAAKAGGQPPGSSGGGVNAERGHANIQGNTDNAISWEILPGYLAIPKPGMNTMADYMAKVPSKPSSPTAVNYFGTNYKKFMVSLLKAWWGNAAQADNDYRYSWIPKPSQNSSWLTIHNEARNGTLDGLF